MLIAGVALAYLVHNISNIMVTQNIIRGKRQNQAMSDDSIVQWHEFHFDPPNMAGLMLVTAIGVCEAALFVGWGLNFSQRAQFVFNSAQHRTNSAAIEI